MPDLADRTDELEDDVHARFEALSGQTEGAQLPEWLDPRYLEGRYVEEMIRQMASEVRLRRTSARLAPAAVEQAHEIRTFRRSEGEQSGTVLEAAISATVDEPVSAASGSTA